MKSGLFKLALVVIIVIPLVAFISKHFQFNEAAVPADPTSPTNGLPFNLEHALNVGVDIHARGIGNLDWQGEKVDDRGGTLGAYTEAVNIFNGTDYSIREVYDVLVKAHPELLTTGKQPYTCADVNEYYHFSVSDDQKYDLSGLKEVLQQGKLAQRMVETDKWRNSRGERVSWPGSHTGLIFYYDGTYFHMKAAGKIKQKNAIYTDQQIIDWMGGSKKRFIIYTKNGYETNSQPSQGFSLEHAIEVAAKPHSKETENLPWHGGKLGEHAGMITAYVDAINILHGTNYTLLEVYNKIVSAHPEIKEENISVYKNEDINDFYNISVSYDEYKATIDNVKNALNEGKVVADIANTKEWRNGKGELWGKTGTHTGLIFYYDGTHYHMKTSVQKNALYTEQQLINWLNDTGDELIIYSRKYDTANNSNAQNTPIPSSNNPLNASPGFRDEWYDGMQYYISIPDNPTEAMPLIIFLHGDGERNNFKKLGNLDIVSYVRSKEPYKVGKFIFIAPVRTSKRWADSGSRTLKTLMNLIEKTANDYKIDKNRIILTGMSSGGNGTWNIACKYPNYFAAILPMSAKTAGAHAEKLTNLPIYGICGDSKDEEPERNRQMRKLIDEINKLNGNKNLTKFETIHGARHGTIQKAYKRLEVFQWMLSQTKGNQNSSYTQNTQIPQTTASNGSYEAVINVMRGWKNMSGKDAHREVIKYYNEYASAHGRHKMDDDLSDRLWCSETASAAYAKAGMADSIGGVSSCVSNYRKHLKEAGCLVENKNATPKPGWIVCYGSGTGHTAMVMEVSGNKLKCYAGGGSGVHKTTVSKGSVRFYGAPFN